MVLHYGQEIFEGQKAYRWADGRVAMFRPDANAARMNRSASRMCMPQIPEELQVEATHAAGRALLRDWVPEPPSSLYVRPTMIASEAALGVRPAKEYLYFIICSPVGPYFPRGSPRPVQGPSEERTSARWSAAPATPRLGATTPVLWSRWPEAKGEGYDANLWLDAKEHRFVEEIGAMNILFVLGRRGGDLPAARLDPPWHHPRLHPAPGAGRGAESGGAAGLHRRDRRGSRADG